MIDLARVPVRFRILALLFVMSFVNYLLRNNLSVAVPSIRDEYGYTSTELGWILGSFNFTYALFQVPGGVFGDRYGARRALAIIAVTWSVLTFLTGFAPTLLAASATGSLVALVAARALLGVANAPIFPVMSSAIRTWFPVGAWAFPNATSSVGLVLGQAALGPVVTGLIVAFGWRESFYVLAPLGLLVGAWWYVYSRDTPAAHPATTPAELELIARGREELREEPLRRGDWRRVLARRDVLALAASYFCMNYVFYMFAQWLFTYLVEERGFSLLESGFLYAMPFVVGAALAAAGGLVCDALCRRHGARFGCRATAMTGLTLVAVFLIAGTRAADPYVAVAWLSLCFGCTQFTEGAYWSAATYAGGAQTATAGGIMNTGGNAAGFLAPVVGALIDHVGWGPTLASGSVFALVGAALWLVVRLQQDAAHGPDAAVS
jgi:ACS family glucarate transporter-like MFS transporter